MNPGWFPDPHDPRSLRYWDGHRWTERTQRTQYLQHPQQAMVPVRSGPSTPLLVSIVVGVAAVIVAVALLVAQPWSDDASGAKSLNVSAVARYIGENFGASSVVCNDGRNVELRRGTTFTCLSADGQRFEVVLTDDKGTYRVAG